MATLFETLGYGTWVDLRKHIGAPLPRELANPRPPSTHTYDSCRKPSQCEEHRRQYRRRLQERKEAQAREETALVTYRRNLANLERMRQVAGATGTSTVSVDDL